MSSHGGCSEAALSLRSEIHELFAENRLSEAADRLRRLLEEGSAEHTDYFCLIAAEWADEDAVNQLSAHAVSSLSDPISKCIPAAIGRLRKQGIGGEVEPSDIQDSVFRLYHEVALITARALAQPCDHEIPDLWCAMLQFRDWYNIGADNDLLSTRTVGCTGVEWLEAEQVRDQPGMGILNNRLSWTRDGTYLALSDVDDLDHPDLPFIGQFHAGYAGRQIWLSTHACHYTESRAGYLTESEQWLFIGGEFSDEGNFRIKRFFTTMPNVRSGQFARGAMKICLVPQVYPEYEVGGFHLRVSEVQVRPPSPEAGEKFRDFSGSVENSGILDAESRALLRSTSNPRHMAALVTYFNTFGAGQPAVFRAYPAEAMDFFNRRAELIEDISF
ncbi:MAG: hypothetical protein ACYS8W_15530 [Planctomycetota bacterium]|jgi:hypothetical protein